ncbi:hypothetical protein [Streptomyces sp. NPDC088258]|uniref:hypothetical protein n=1 Tax=Streptomyces sp. NPDC088258 TaxID=3365849 RepID=UPI0037F85233
MLDIPRAVVFLVFVLGITVFALVYLFLTVTLAQRSVLVWMLIPLLGGIGAGLSKGESIDALLFSLGGFFLMFPFLLLLPRGRRRELNRREAAGEKVDWQEAAPPTWAVLVFAGAVCLWGVFSFVAVGG